MPVVSDLAGLPSLSSPILDFTLLTTSLYLLYPTQIAVLDVSHLVSDMHISKSMFDTQVQVQDMIPLTEGEDYT